MTGTPTFDVHPLAAQSWRLLSERVRSERDPRLRSNLELVARHVEAEVRGDLDALMATLVEQPIYRYLGATATPGPRGAEQVRAYYAESVAAGKNRLEFEIDRVIADDRAVVTEGVFRHAYRGRVLLERGSPPDVVKDAGAWYLVEYHSLVVWPISEDGRLSGEDVHLAEAPRVVRQLAADEAPQLGPVDRFRTA